MLIKRGNGKRGETGHGRKKELATFNRTYDFFLFSKLVDLQICEMENINSNAFTLYIDFHTIFSPPMNVILSCVYHQPTAAVVVVGFYYVHVEHLYIYSIDIQPHITHIDMLCGKSRNRAEKFSRVTEMCVQVVCQWWKIQFCRP